MAEIDHIVLGARTLEEGAAFVTSLLGVKPQPGGKHEGAGTHNLLLGLGPDCYLEIIAPDPSQPEPAHPRLFDLDDPATKLMLEAGPHLVGWVARTPALDAVAGRRVIDADITVLPVAAPFTLDVVKDGGLSARGSVPTEDLRAALGLGDAAAGLVLAAGAPAGWDKLAMAGIAAMAPLGKATLHLSDSTLTLTGTALGPEEAAAARSALAALPAAVAVW